MNQTNGVKFTEKKGFFGRFGYLVLLGSAVGVLALTIALVNLNKDPAVKTPVDVQPTVVFTMPVLNATVLKGYSGTELQYNATLRQWEAHKAIDFKVEAGTDVLAAFDGTIKSIETTYEHGTTIVIAHVNGIETSYGSLSSTVKVKTGDKVTKGQAIGVVADSAAYEVDDGAHLHFEVYEAGAKIDPAKYLSVK